jgi:hypothetical protein
LSEKERTPKAKLKALEPDLTVVVGGIELYHFKAVFCSGCDFFDKMISFEMKENGRIESSFQTKIQTSGWKHILLVTRVN